MYYIFWHSFWHTLWHSFWHSVWHLWWHSVWHSIWHSLWHVFGFSCAPQHPELAIWCSGPGTLHSIRSWWRRRKTRRREEKEEDEEEEEEGRRRLAPLLKSRDPHLAGGKNLLGSLRFFFWLTFTVQVSALIFQIPACRKRQLQAVQPELLMPPQLSGAKRLAWTNLNTTKAEKSIEKHGRAIVMKLEALSCYVLLIYDNCQYLKPCEFQHSSQFVKPNMPEHCMLSSVSSKACIMASGTLLGAWSAGYWEMFRDLHDPPNGPRIKEVAFLFLLCAAKIVLKFYAYQYPMVSLTIGPNLQVDHHLPQ